MIYTSPTLTAISAAVGYDSIHAFSKVFRRQEGIFPSRFRSGVREELV